MSFVLQSQLTIASDKSRGILGKCDLDMAKFSYDDFNVLRLNIGECQYEGSWIEVGLKAVPANRSSTRAVGSNLLDSSYRSTTTVDTGAASASSDPNMTQQRYTELLDKFQEDKKRKRQVEGEKVKEIQQLQQRNNQL